MLNARGLKSRGYMVLEAGNGVEALEVFNREGGIARKFAEIKVDYADVEKIVVELLKK